MSKHYIKGITSLLKKANIEQLRVILTFAKHYLSEV